MGHAVGLSPEEQRKADIKVGRDGFIILLLITLGEVGVALLGNGHLIEGFAITKWIMVPVMIAMSLYKAYYIVSIFMHLGHEVRSMAMSVVLPMLLLVWAVIAFLWEGDSARNNRNRVNGGDPLKKQQPASSSEKTSLKLDSELSKSITLI